MIIKEPERSWVHRDSQPLPLRGMGLGFLLRGGLFGFHACWLGVVSPRSFFLDPGGLGFLVDPLKLLRELECFSPYSLWFFEEDASCIDCLVCSPFMWL